MKKPFVIEKVSVAADFIPQSEGCFKILTGEITSEKEITEFIHRRRRQLIVHSIIYYRMNDNVISDHKWQQWADELRDVQNKYPQYCEIGFHDDRFAGWTGATGYNLDVPEMIPVAAAILEMKGVFEQQ